MMPIPNAAEIAELYQKMGYNDYPGSAQPDTILAEQELEIVMIIMADADMSAVINYFKTILLHKTNNSKHFNLKKIWIQEPVIDVFIERIVEAQLSKVVILDRSMLATFRNNDEVICAVNKETSREYGVSVWSENINIAQNVAALLHTFIIWINTSSLLDACVSNIINSSIQPEYAVPESNISARVVTEGSSEYSKRFELFYDGQWKKPVKQEYWIGESELLTANATAEDIEECAISAARAFQTWSLTPLSKRKKIFQCLADRISSTGDHNLANSIMRWANNSSVCESSTFFIRDGTVNLLTRRDPQGIIVIASVDKEDLFRMLVYACITGNTVIIASSDHFGETIVEYCDMFPSCGFPPGLVNSLTFANLTSAIQHMSTLPRISRITTGHICFEGNRVRDSDRDLILKFTKPKCVWMPCK